MSELIKLCNAQIGGAAVQTVNARDLHAFLGVQTAFKDWIVRRIQDFGFADGSDFCSFLSESAGGRPAREYHLTLDMAKELAMVERNARGKEARQYFIECERRAKEGTVNVRDPKQLTSIALQLIELNDELRQTVAALETKVEEQRADVDALATLTKADGSLCMTDAAKALQQRPKDLIAYLKAHNWIYRRAGGDHWIGYQSRIQSGDLEHKVTTVLRADGSEKVTEQVRVTPQGLTKLAKLFPPPVSRAA